MSHNVSRRSFLKAALAGSVVLGFNPTTRSWVTSAHAEGSYNRLPALDGVVYTDDASRADAADDYGHIIHRTPFAVLKPGSVNDVVLAVRFCREHNLKVAGRGRGHSTYGQPQVESGLVIDTSSLATIHSIGADRATVDAGVQWITLLQATLAQGLTPPVLTDYIELSVGGTLSVGGIGGTSHKYGVQVDNVLELDVVTGEGKLVRCSDAKNRDLFNAVLAGLGQCGIIVRATVRLVHAETQARVYTLYYDDLNVFTADQRKVITDERFSYVEGQAVFDASTNTWRYMLEAASFYTPPAQPNNAALTSDLHYTRGSEGIEDKSYFDFANRLAPTVAFLKSIGVWGLPHPWFDVFVPGSQVNSYVGGIVPGLTMDDTGQGPVLLYPVKTARFTRPLFRVPSEPVTFLFDILRTAPPVPAVIAAMVASNRQLFERDRDIGGNRYAIGAIPFSRADWQQHFGAVWPLLVAAKRRFDPDNILTPGQGIF